MIYDFEGHTPKIDQDSWVASNSVIIGRVELKKNSISSIQKISENIAANIIENISGEKLNESSIKATIEDVSKKNIGKYL